MLFKFDFMGDIFALERVNVYILEYHEIVHVMQIKFQNDRILL